MGNGDKGQTINAANAAVRAVNFEALRILCMAMIVVYHCMVHGNVSARIPEYSINWYVYQIIYPFLQVGVNCYVLISGYFLCESRFRVKRILSVWMTTLFWSVCLRSFSIIISHTDFNVVEVVKAFIPITQREYWFATSYLLMYLCTPFLNQAIKHMTRKQHGSFLLMIFAVFIVLQNITFWNDFTFASGHSPAFFIILYVAAAYIRKYPPAIKKNWAVYFLMISLLCGVLDTVVTVVSRGLLGQVFGGTAFTSFNSVTIFLASIFLFLAFREIEISPRFLGKCILTVSPNVFGIYLIHDHNDIRSLIWNEIFHCSEWGTSAAMILKIIGASMTVFVICLLIEATRRRMWKLCHMDAKLERISTRMEDYWERCVDYLDGMWGFED